MWFYSPGSIIETALPPITSSQLSVIPLDWENDFEKVNYQEIRYPAWEMAQDRLSRLAESFSAGNPGKKMKAEIFWYCSDGPQKSYFLGHAKFNMFLPGLKDEVTLGTHD